MHNPVAWVDPLGLESCDSQKLGRNMMKDMGLSNITWKGYQAQHIIPGQLLGRTPHPILQKIGFDELLNQSANGIFLPSRRGGISSLSRHYGSHPGYNQAIANALDRLNINDSVDVLSRQVADIQNKARIGMQNGMPIMSREMIPFGKTTREGTQRIFELWDKYLK